MEDEEFYLDEDGETEGLALEALQDLRHGIDVEKKVITATHNLSNKLAAFEQIYPRVMMNYGERETELFDGILRIIRNLESKLASMISLGKHILVEEEVAQKSGSKWILKHKHIVDDEVKKEKKLLKKEIQELHKATQKVLKVAKRFGKHEDEEFKEIIQRIKTVFSTYEAFFAKLLKEMK